MEQISSPPSLHAVAALATVRHGPVTGEQLAAIGISREQIRRHRERGYLHRLAEDLYAVGHVGLSRRGLANAALLKAGTARAAISHESAGRSWEMLPTDRTGPIHVSVLDRRDLEMPAGVVLHRPRSLRPEDIVDRLGLPTTTPERTLLDLLPALKTEEISRMLERMVTILGRSPDDLHGWANTLGRVRGKARLIAALDHIVGPAVLRSELEVQFRNVCQRGGLPLPDTNVRVGRWEVDALWRRYGLIVELDSFRFHGGRWQFDRDREKGLDLAAAGYEVLRLTWPQVKHTPDIVAAKLRAILERRAGHAGMLG